MPSSRHARMMRIAIVTRFPTSSFLNIAWVSALAALRSALAGFDHHQRLPVFDRLPAFAQDPYHPAARVGLDLVHHLHRLDNAQGLALAHRAALFNERVRVRR